MSNKIVNAIVKRLWGGLIKEEVDSEVKRQARKAIRYSDRPQRGSLLDRYDEFALDGQASETDVHELLDRYALQPGLRAPVDKVAKIVGTCTASIKLKDKGKENAADREYLTQLIEHPDGRKAFTTILFETIVKLKVLGECFWELIYPDQAALDATRTVATKAISELLSSQEHARIKSLDPTAPDELPRSVKRAITMKATRVVDGAIKAAISRPVGYRVIQGTVNPILDKNGYFKDPAKAFVQITTSGERAYFGVNDVLWMRGPNPLGGAHALPPFESIRFIDDIDEKVYVYYNAVLDNRGELGGVITVKNPGVGELDRIRQEIDGQHKGPENAGKWYVVGVEGDGDTKVDAFGTEPIKLEELEAGMRRLRLMWSVLNVPGGKVGFINDVNRANIEMQDKALLEEEVIPLCKLVADPFNQFIQVQLGITDYYLEFSQADLRTESEKAEIRRAKFRMGTVTLNELLAEEYGDQSKKVKDGDIRIVELDAGILVFTKDHPVHVLSASGTCVPLFTDTSSPGPEVVDPTLPRNRPLGPDVDPKTTKQPSNGTTKPKPKP